MAIIRVVEAAGGAEGVMVWVEAAPEVTAVFPWWEKCGKTTYRRKDALCPLDTRKTVIASKGHAVMYVFWHMKMRDYPRHQRPRSNLAALDSGRRD